ncbi:MAG: hypothetical protein ACR2KK_10770 [Acidimicrobiales bacterium]
MRRVALAVGLILALAPACSGRSSGSPDVTVARPEIDEVASLNRILAGLDGVMGDLQRTLVRERRITPEVTDLLQSIYTGPELLNQIDAFRADVANGLTGYRKPPGNRVTTVSRLITASPICVFAEVSRDYAPVTEGRAPRPASLYVILVEKSEVDDPKQLNPTPWAMLYDGVQADGSQPDDVCR